jgi:hypothetical protein
MCETQRCFRSSIATGHSFAPSCPSESPRPRPWACAWP